MATHPGPGPYDAVLGGQSSHSHSKRVHIRLLCEHGDIALLQLAMTLKMAELGFRQPLDHDRGTYPARRYGEGLYFTYLVYERD